MDDLTAYVTSHVSYDSSRIAEAQRFRLVAHLSILEGRPPKVLWLQLGNCKTFEIERLLIEHFESIKAFLLEDDETCLILERRFRRE